MHALKSGELLCIGHRGAMGHEPENTLRSIAKALELGAPWIEIDVYSVQGNLVVIHDDTLERTTNGSGRVVDQTFEYLRSLDAGKGEKIPTLAEVFDLVDRRAGINIELKGPGVAKSVAALVETYRAKGWKDEMVLVSSFNHRDLMFIKNLDSRLNTGALVYGIPLDEASFGSRLRAVSVNPSIDFIDERFVADAHKRSLKVLAYTADTPSDIERMRALGVDGVFTNYPERVLG